MKIDRDKGVLPKMPFFIEGEWKKLLMEFNGDSSHIDVGKFPNWEIFRQCFGVKLHSWRNVT